MSVGLLRVLVSKPDHLKINKRNITTTFYNQAKEILPNPVFGWHHLPQSFGELVACVFSYPLLVALLPAQ